MSVISAAGIVAKNASRVLAAARTLTSRTIAWAIVLAGGAFLALGSFFDLASGVRGILPSDHSATFTALTGTTFKHAASAALPTTRYITHLEIGYAVYELALALLFLAVAAIPLRREERWAWWSCWLIILPLAGFGAVFGPHDELNLIAAIVAIFIVAIALLVLRPSAAQKTQVEPSTR